MFRIAYKLDNSDEVRYSGEYEESADAMMEFYDALGKKHPNLEERWLELDRKGEWARGNHV